MQLKHYCKGRFRTIGRQRLFHHRAWMIMKLTVIFILAACLQVSAKGFSQRVTLNGKNVPLEKVFREIKQQTGYLFVYRDEWLKQARNVDVNISNGTVEQVLDSCFQNQPLTYSIIDKTVVLQLKEEERKLRINFKLYVMSSLCVGSSLVLNVEDLSRLRLQLEK